MTGNIAANRDIYADIINTGQIHDRRTINLIISDVKQFSELLKQPDVEIQAGPEQLGLPPGWAEAMHLLAQDERVDRLDRYQAYAAWLVSRQPQRPPQLIAARNHFIPLPGRLSLEESLLRPQFSERRIVGQGPQRQIERIRLKDVTEAVGQHPAFVLLGPPGSGKSTVLHRLTLNAARAFLTGREHRLPLLLTLADYDWQQTPAPLDFVSRRWHRLVGDDFVELARSGRMLLLADGLNEMLRLENSGERRRRANGWERFINDYFSQAGAEGSRAIIASRDRADYDQPLGLPRVEIDPLNDDQIANFLRAYLNEQSGSALEAIKRLDLLEQARIPYPLFILSQLYDPVSGDLPPNRGQMFEGYARWLLAGEKEAGHEWYDLEAALAALAHLGYALQQRGESTVLAAADLLALLPPEVRLPNRPQPTPTPPQAVFNLACQARLFNADTTAAAADAYKFSHQLLQEQFAAQHLLVRRRAGEDLSLLWATPRSHREMPPADVGEWDPLPPPPATGWEQAAILAAGITPRPDAFVQVVLAVNPALAGRCINEGAAPVTPETRAAAQQALLQDLGNPALHRRARIQAGQVLGQVGDPRFVPVAINGVEIILPHLLAVPGGAASLGARRWPFDRQAFADERPQHQVEVAPFYLARTPLTNAEYACFIRAGGYDNESYWTPTGWQWRHGQLEESGPVEEILDWYRYYRDNPHEIDKRLKAERMTPDTADTLRVLIQMPEDEVRQLAQNEYAPHPHQQPHYWDDPAYNAPNQPVVGVTWFEAMAYCAWLNEQTAKGKWTNLQPADEQLRPEQTAIWNDIQSKIKNLKSKIRLPTEAEWEWAAGGPGHTRYPWGQKFDPDKANTLEGRALTTSPVGAYPAGAADCGALDMSGNVWEWTHTIYEAYPYRVDDGREETERTNVRRALRGGGWDYNGRNARVSSRDVTQPADFSGSLSFRVIVAPVIL